MHLFIITILCVFLPAKNLNAAGSAISQMCNWGSLKYHVNFFYHQDSDETILLVARQNSRGDSMGYLDRLKGFIEVKIVKEFCGSKKDAVILISREGSSGHMKYNVFGLNPRTGKLIRIPGPTREIPAGDIVVDNGGFFVFSGVRYSVAYFREGFVVEKKPLATVVKKDIPAIIFSQRMDGMIEIYPLDVSRKEVRIRKNKKLFFLRNDLYGPVEDIRCEGLVMELPEDDPSTRVFPETGEGIIIIEIERSIAEIPLTVIE